MASLTPNNPFKAFLSIEDQLADLALQQEQLRKQELEKKTALADEQARAAASAAVFKTAIFEAIDKGVLTFVLPQRLVETYIELSGDNQFLTTVKLLARILRHPLQGLRVTENGYWFKGETYSDPLEIVKKSELKDIQAFKELRAEALVDLMSQVTKKEETHFGVVRAAQDKVSKADLRKLTKQDLFKLQHITGDAF